MGRGRLPRPTDAELAILRALWQRGPSTAWEAQTALSRARPAGSTTAFRLLQIVTEKGLVGPDESQRARVYQAQLAEEQTRRQLLRDLLRRGFGCSAQKLVVQALATKKVSPEEALEIGRLLDELQGGPK